MNHAERACDPCSPPGAEFCRSDDALLQQVAAGNQAAFTDLYDRVVPSVYGISRRVLVDPALAEEVTQEVLLAVWSTAALFDASRGSARNWIMTMAHRRAVDVVRSEQAARDRTARAGLMVDRPFDDVAEEVLQRFSDRSAARRVELGLAALTMLQRGALELAYFGGFTHREVAMILDVPLGTAKTRIRDGLRRLTLELTTPN